MSEQNHPKIYLLPNLMTAGNLFCGFTATLKILEGALLQSSNSDAAGDLFHTAIWFILAACFFDLLDGRLARLGGHEGHVQGDEVGRTQIRRLGVSGGHVSCLPPGVARRASASRPEAHRCRRGRHARCRTPRGRRRHPGARARPAAGVTPRSGGRRAPW